MRVLGIGICIVLAVAAAIISYRQLKEKGFLFNNAYLFAFSDERKQMDKKPHYRQSGIVFGLISVMFILNAASMFTGLSGISGLSIVMGVILLIYAVVSSIWIEMKRS